MPHLPGCGQRPRGSRPSARGPARSHACRSPASAPPAACRERGRGPWVPAHSHCPTSRAPSPCRHPSNALLWGFWGVSIPGLHRASPRFVVMACECVCLCVDMSPCRCMCVSPCMCVCLCLRVTARVCKCVCLCVDVSPCHCTCVSVCVCSSQWLCPAGNTLWMKTGNHRGERLQTGLGVQLGLWGQGFSGSPDVYTPHLAVTGDEEGLQRAQQEPLGTAHRGEGARPRDPGLLGAPALTSFT